MGTRGIDLELFARLIDNGSITGETLCAHVSCSGFLTPYLVGVIGSAFGLGIICFQMLDFWSLFPEERFRRHKALLLLVFAFNIIHTASAMSLVIKVLTYHFGDFNYFVVPRVEDAIVPFSASLIQGLTQLYLLVRAWSFARYRGWHTWIVRPAGVFLATCLGVSAAGACLVAVRIKQLNNLIFLALNIKRSRSYYVAFPLSLTTSVIFDILISIIIVIELWSPKKEMKRSASFESTKEIATRLVRMIVRSGVLVTVLQISVLVLWEVEMHAMSAEHWSSWILAASFVLPKVYTITLLYAMSVPRTYRVKTMAESLSSKSQRTRDLFTLPWKQMSTEKDTSTFGLSTTRKQVDIPISPHLLAMFGGNEPASPIWPLPRIPLSPVAEMSECRSPTLGARSKSQSTFFTQRTASSSGYYPEPFAYLPTPSSPDLISLSPPRSPMTASDRCQSVESMLDPALSPPITPRNRSISQKPMDYMPGDTSNYCFPAPQANATSYLPNPYRLDDSSYHSKASTAASSPVTTRFPEFLNGPPAQEYEEASRYRRPSEAESVASVKSFATFGKAR